MKIKLKSFLEMLVAICIVLDCETIWKWMNHSGYVKAGIFLCLVFSLIILIFFIQKKVKVKTTIFLIILIYLGIFVIRNIFESFINATQFAIIILLFYLYFREKENIYNVLNKVSTLVTILAIISIFFFIFGSVLHILKPTNNLTIYVNNNPKIVDSYFGLHYEVQKENTFGIELYRNTGIFYEAPKYTLILSIILMYELFILKNKNKKRNIILSITILTTMSLTGIFGLILIWLGYIFFKDSIKTYKGILIKAVFFIILLLFSYEFIDVFAKTMAIKSDTASYSTRMDNYIAGFKAWMDNPIFGAGYLNMKTIISYYSSFRLNDIGYSNSLFRILAQGGIFLILMYIIPIIKFLVTGFKNKNPDVIYFGALFIYFFITTSFSYNFIMILLLFFMCNFDKKRNEYNNKISIL